FSHEIVNRGLLAREGIGNDAQLPLSTQAKVIKECSGFIVIISGASLKSPRVCFELGSALSLGKEVALYSKGKRGVPVPVLLSKLHLMHSAGAVSNELDRSVTVGRNQ